MATAEYRRGHATRPRYVATGEAQRNRTKLWQDPGAVPPSVLLGIFSLVDWAVCAFAGRRYYSE